MNEFEASKQADKIVSIFRNKSLSGFPSYPISILKSSGSNSIFGIKK